MVDESLGFQLRPGSNKRWRGEPQFSLTATDGVAIVFGVANCVINHFMIGMSMAEFGDMFLILKTFGTKTL